MKLLRKLLIYAIPFLLLVLFFLIFEPYDYFTVKGDALYSSRPLSSMRELLKDKPTKIIIGDSQMANLNVDYINEITGEDYETLAFGGAFLRESIELFWFAADRCELEQVVFGVSFYSLGRYSDFSRMADVFEQAENPFKFATRFNYWLEAISAAKYKALNVAANVLSKEEWRYVPEDPTRFDTPDASPERGEVYRKNLEDYAEIIYKQTGKKYTIIDDAFKELQKIIDYCDEKGIEIIFVFPPVHESIFTNVIEPLGISDEIQEAKQFLIDRAVVYDFQTLNDFTRNEDNFYDGFHLANTHKREFAEMLFVGCDTDALTIYR